MPTFHERRQPVRKDLCLRLAVIDKDAQRPIGQLLNVSSEGALLKAGSELTCHRPYNLQTLLLCSDGCMSKLELPAEPMWGKHEVESGYFYYGIQFYHPNDDLVWAPELIMNELSLEDPRHYH